MEKLYWRLYKNKGAVIREGDHFETDTGDLLFWHSYEQTEALTFLADAADIAEKAAKIGEPTPPPPPVAIRVRFKREVDRYPHALIAEGELGTYIGHRMGEDAVRLDRHVPELDEWQNCVMWYDESVGFNGYVWDDVEEVK